MQQERKILDPRLVPSSQLAPMAVLSPISQAYLIIPTAPIVVVPLVISRTSRGKRGRGHKGQNNRSYVGYLLYYVPSSCVLQTS
jgi:hypothetical protein